MQILYVQIHGFVSQAGGVMPPPCRDTKPPFCVGCQGDGPTPPQDKIWTSMALQHELPPKNFTRLCQVARLLGFLRIFLYNAKPSFEIAKWMAKHMLWQNMKINKIMQKT